MDRPNAIGMPVPLFDPSEGANMKPDKAVSARKGEWLVMDGRARFDTDEASIMEALGHGREDQPPRKAARSQWQGYDACLCFCPDLPGNGRMCGPAEYVEDVK